MPTEITDEKQYISTSAVKEILTIVHNEDNKKADKLSAGFTADHLAMIDSNGAYVDAGVSTNDLLHTLTPTAYGESSATDTFVNRIEQNADGSISASTKKVVLDCTITNDGRLTFNNVLFNVGA